ncbi:MAG: YkgJ family cysteine cluster protein [Candidatus Hodarchaeales archaeon]
MKFTCQRSGNCCSHPKMFITLTYHDLIPLLGATKSTKSLIDSVSFLRLEKTITGGEKEQLLEQLVIRPMKTEEGEVIPVLKKKKENSECIFYNNSNHSCKIYDNRPLACQLFPIGLTEINKRKAVSWNTLAKDICPGINKGENISESSLKLLSKKAEEYIKDTNEKIDIINQETNNKGKKITSKEGLLTLLLLSDQFHKK